jgi:hypothetical protein
MFQCLFISLLNCYKEPISLKTKEESFFKKWRKQYIIYEAN